MAKGTHRADGWASGSCPPPQITAAQALNIERAVNHCQDVLAHAPELASEHGASYALGSLEVVVRQLLRELDGAL